MSVEYSKPATYNGVRQVEVRLVNNDGEHWRLYIRRQRDRRTWDIWFEEYVITKGGLKLLHQCLETGLSLRQARKVAASRLWDNELVETHRLLYDTVGNYFNFSEVTL